MFSQSKNFCTKLLFLLAPSLLVSGALDALAGKHHPCTIVTIAALALHTDPGSRGLLQKTRKLANDIKIKKRPGEWQKTSRPDGMDFIQDKNVSVKIAQGKKTLAGKETTKQPPGRQSQMDVLRRRKEHIRREIEKGRQDVAAFSDRESEVIERLNRVELALDTSRKRAAEKKKEIEKLDHMIHEASTASRALRSQIQANKENVSRRLVALYKMSRLGKYHLLASAKSMNEFIQRNTAFERILAYDEKIRRNLMENQAQLKKELTDLNRHKALKSEHAAEFQKQIRLISQERSRRAKILADIRKQKALELAAIDALTKAAEKLERKLKSMKTARMGAVSNKNSSQLPFPAYKGLLIMPVKGKITNLFGPYKNPKYNITNFRSGIDIKADYGEPVRSVFKGEVIFSNWFKGYGNMIIIGHGNSYYTVYAHMQEAFKSKGEKVNAGEVIGVVGDTGSMSGAKLYFEVRHHGKPMNPLNWLKKG